MQYIVLRKLTLLFLLLPGCYLGAYTQSCKLTQFSTRFVFTYIGERNFLEVLPNDQLLFGGQKNSQLILIKTDDTGSIIWQMKYYAAASIGPDALGKLAVDANGNYFASLQFDHLALINPAGHLIRARKMDLPFDKVNVTDLGTVANGDKIVLVRDYSSYGVNGYVLMRLSNNLSSIIWQKHINGYNLYLNELTVDNNILLITGRNVDDGLILSFDATTGNQLNKLTLKMDDKQCYIYNIYPYGNGYVANGKYFLGAPHNHFILRLDKSLNVTNSFRFQGIADWCNVTLDVQPDGSVFGASGSAGFGYLQFQMTAKDSLLWARYNMASLYGYTNFVRKTSKGLITFSGMNYYYGGTDPQSIFTISRSTLNGVFSNCNTTEYDLQTVSLPYTRTNGNINVRDTTLVTLSSPSMIGEPESLTPTRTCIATSECDSLKILAPPESCSTGEGTYKAWRNPGCFTPIKWTITGGNVEKLEYNDSTINIKFLQMGQYKLVAELVSDCEGLRDSITISVPAPALYLNLGQDTLICPGNRITLNARKGFASYLWQDGSTDSVFQVSQPGTYYVQTVDYCGNAFHDTVEVSPHPPIPFYVGPDRTKCNNDTLHVQAPSGFLNYTWSNNYNISSLTDQQVVVFPNVDTTYYVRAEKTPGCFAFDTIHISVHRSPAIQLGNDASFCSGDSIVLDAGSGFTSYLWSNGSSTQRISAKTTGAYRVMGTTAEGCHSYDTIQVLNVWQLPNVTLDPNPELCFQSTRILDAGAFTSYLWQDGSTARTFVVNSLGDYHVMVTDVHSCKGYDTVHIQTTIPNPKGFLPADTAICTYATLNLNPLLQFNTYLWSDGTNRSTISISKAGQYWLEVKDNKNCVGKDTIQISPKDCLKGVFIPNAFTPAKDGKNDVFRALVNGPIRSFELTVYNRWGQLVFQTREWSKGWDGTLSGRAVASDSFVWMCKYQFEGEEMKVEKGTVMLLR